MRLRPAAARTFLLAAGTCVGLVLAELLVRIFAPQVYPVHPPGMYVEDAEVGYTLAPGFEGLLERSEFRDSIRIEASGFRGVHVAGDPSAADTLDVFVLGDSQTFGFGVDEEETFSARLAAMEAKRRSNTAVRVVNGGVPGYGTADQLALLRSRGPAIEPDLVLVQFLSVNDLQDNLEPAREWAAIEDGMLVRREGADSSHAPWLRRVHGWITTRSHLAHFLSNLAGYLLARHDLSDPRGAMWGENFSAEQARLGTDLLVDVARTADSLGAETLFLYTTGQISVIQDEYTPLPSRSVVAEAAERAGVPWVDVTQQLRERPDRMALHYPIDGHWTAAGHRAVAEVVARQLGRLELSP